jgi:DNA-binding CsgD family transcriptional regulator/tetratricopeptide (TPR) repeat protein
MNAPIREEEQMSMQTEQCASPRGSGVIVGREAEQRRLDALVERAGAGNGAAIALRGEPGIGKTTLLDDVAERASGMTVLRCAGIEGERELAFAAIHQLVRPHANLIESLPAPQAEAMGAALGLTYGDAPDRFLVSLGLLGLLDAICGEHGPVLCCIDDAQWLDRPSAEALVFVARRVHAGSIAVVIATRDGETERLAVPGIPDLELTGLDDEHARALLAAHLDRAPAPAVTATLLRAARGNPLALEELSSALNDAQLDGVEPILGPPPVGGDVQAAFGERVAQLPEATRLALLLAAADDDRHVAAIERAAARLGLQLADLDPAERAGLVRIGVTIEFRHPLLRSVVYGAATHAQRRTAHETLAAVIDDRMRAAWHRALVAERADERIAAELASGAEQAANGGEHASAAAAFERAAELSDDPARRGQRLCAAAHAALDAGRLDAALALVGRARPLVTDPAQLARLTTIHAVERSRRGSIAEAEALLREPGFPRPWAELVALQRGGDECSRAVVDVDRLDEAGLPGQIAALTVRADARVAARRVKEAATTVARALAIAHSHGFDNDEIVLLAVRARIAAFEGRETDCRQDAEVAIRRGIANGLGWATCNARLALAELEAGLGNAREALDQLGQLPAEHRATAIGDRVDAALRLGEPELAAAALERVAGAGHEGVLARCQAQLTADEASAERLFLEALDAQSRDALPFERARTELAYGERLRRDRRKVDARIQLRAALDTFAGLGATLWAERACGELRATGETARKRDVTTVDDLTPQEQRIAELVATGASNRDVASQLFVSPKTVEYHLRKVFQKCGVASRVELARMPLQGLAA